MKEEKFLSALRSNKLKRATRILKDIKEELPRKRFLYLEGLLLESKGELKEALKRFDMALVLHLSDETLWLAKAKVLMELGRLDMAKRASDRACRLSNEDPAAHLLFAEILYRTKDYSNAVKQVDLALGYGESSAEALTLKGILLSILEQDYMSALKYFDSAIDSNGEYGRAWSNRGMALRQIGDEDGAVYSFQKALLINREDENARKMLINMGYGEFIASIERKEAQESEEEEPEDYEDWGGR